MASRTAILAVLGWCATVAFLAAGVPLFLRMPLWCDATLHDLSARNMLAGGVHYRDVFDTNPPGFGWLLCAVRVTLGPSPEAVRAVDLGIVAGVMTALLVLARRAGATPVGVAWAAAAAAAFYPFIHEFNHVQRDVWMMPPAVAAIWLRVRRVEEPNPLDPPSLGGKGGADNSSPFPGREGGRGVRWAGSSAVLEGLLWGLGCWVKPQLVFVAAIVWLVSAGRLGSVRRTFLDLTTVIAGGLIAGLAGLAWLVATGAWPHFLDVWVNWNPAYAAAVRREFLFRLTIQLDYFPPYSLFALLAVPLAVWNLRDRSSPDPVRWRRAMLAGLYLAWLLTTLLFQRGFHYAHVPETLLMLAVFAANRWPVPAAVVLIQCVSGLVLLVVGGNPTLTDAHRQVRQANWLYRQLTERNAAFDPERMRWWAGCFEATPPRELRRGVARWANHFGGHDPVELGAVADFLRHENVGDGELIAWHDSPHALYLELGIRPGLRFLHVGTASGFGPWHREQLLRELRAAAPHARFAVSDMYRITADHAALTDVDADGLPRVLPDWQRHEFPFDQPVEFRSPNGRYLVHRVVNPVRSCAIPTRLDQADPNPRP